MRNKNVNKPAQTVVDAVDCEPETGLTRPSEEDVTRTDKLSTGFALLDRAINGLPQEGCFVALAGKNNHSKSTFLDNLTVGLLENNPDTIVFLHAIDDALGARIPRLPGAKSNYPSEYFKRLGYWLKHPDKLPARYRHFDEIYQQAQAWLSNMISTERLILADVAGLAPQLPGLEVWVRSIRAKWPNRSLAVLGDNLHLYDILGMEPGEAKAREMSMFVMRLTTQYRCTILMPVQQSKAWSHAGESPRIAGGGEAPVAASRASATSICNELKDLGNPAKLVWYDIGAEHRRQLRDE
jgi:hypothetical protein